MLSCLESHSSLLHMGSLIRRTNWHHQRAAGLCLHVLSLLIFLLILMRRRLLLRIQPLLLLQTI